MSQKPRSDAVLKNLPRERQEQIIEWCDTPKSEDCVGGLQHARQQLAADGLSTSLRALSKFYAWFGTQDIYERATERSEQQKELMLQFDPEAVERAEAFGDFCFLQEAQQAKDAKTYAAIRNVRLTDKALELKSRADAAKFRQKDRSLAQKDREIELAQRRVKLLEENAAAAKEKLTEIVKNTGGLSKEAREQIEEAANLL